MPSLSRGKSDALTIWTLNVGRSCGTGIVCKSGTSFAGGIGLGPGQGLTLRPAPRRRDDDDRQSDQQHPGYYTTGGLQFRPPGTNGHGIVSPCLGELNRSVRAARID